jgi:hypothetical protein
VNFIWVNRCYKSFEWFIDLLAKIEMEQSRQCYLNNYTNPSDILINLHLYITSESSEMVYKSKNGSIILHPGRPDIDKVF